MVTCRQPYYVPDFQIQINDENLPAALQGSIMSVNYQDGIEGADRVEVVLANENLRWLDHPLLQVDNLFSLRIGYAPDPLEKVFVGEITGVNASFPSGGIPTLTIVAHDFLQRLTKGTKERAFFLNLPTIGHFPLSDDIVAALVSVSNLLIPFPDPVGGALSFLTLLLAYTIDALDAKKAVRLQQGGSDFDFLAQIARENGWEMYIDHTLEPKGYILRFRFLFQDYAPAVSLKWGQSLIDFTPRLTTVGQVIAVTTRIWVASIKTEFVVVLAWDYERTAFDLQIYPGNILLENISGLDLSQNALDVEVGGPALVPKKLLSELLPRLNNRLTGSGSTIGNPEIKAGQVINLEGLGEQFSGLYRITSSTHSFDSGGYRTSFDARKEVWFGSIPIPQKASGLVRVQGQTIS